MGTLARATKRMYQARVRRLEQGSAIRQEQVMHDRKDTLP